MPITTPDQLVEEFKKSGEFDRLRRELLAQFRSSDGMVSLMNKVEDIARQKLAADQKLQYMPEASAVRELMQELDRYPVVERAVADVRTLSDPSFASNIRDSVNRILQEDRRDKTKTDTSSVTGKDSSTTPARQVVAQQSTSSAHIFAKAVTDEPAPGEAGPPSQGPEDEKATRAVRFEVDASAEAQHESGEPPPPVVDQPTV